VYFELDREREKLGRKDVAILRPEQIYPLGDETLEAVVAAYRDGPPSTGSGRAGEHGVPGDFED